MHNNNSNNHNNRFTLSLITNGSNSNASGCQSLTLLTESYQPAQRTLEWYEFRHGMITASNVCKAFGSDALVNAGGRFALALGHASLGGDVMGIRIIVFDLALAVCFVQDGCNDHAGNAFHTFHNHHVAFTKRLRNAVSVSSNVRAVLREQVVVQLLLSVREATEVPVQEGPDGNNRARQERFLELKDLVRNALACQEGNNLVAEVVAAVREKVVLLDARVPFGNIGRQPCDKLLMRDKRVAKPYHGKILPHFRLHQMDTPGISERHSEGLFAWRVTAEDFAAIPILALKDDHSAVNSLDLLAQEQWAQLGSRPLGDVVEQEFHRLLFPAQHVSHDFPEVDLSIAVDICVLEDLVLHLGDGCQPFRFGLCYLSICACLRLEVLQV
mmetsp:Transcript_30620/g.54753  ORF Transcript_30620/g.54753 Transcript_30620/m.54753 type:complete len:385 (+) Transcript_30620:1-1155(+)